MAQCAESLKQRVAVDEQGGSKVFLDERTGTIAMTIYGKTEAALTEEFLREKLKQGNPAGVDPQVLERQAREEAQEVLREKTDLSNGLTTTSAAKLRWLSRTRGYEVSSSRSG